MSTEMAGSDESEKLQAVRVFSWCSTAYRDQVMRAMDHRQARSRARVLELLDIRHGEKVADLGCGPGTLTSALASSAGETGWVLAVDLSEMMLTLAADSVGGANVSLARMDMESLAIADGVFDAVACGHAFQFCPDLRRGLTEARRVLRPGGRLAASVPADRSAHPAVRLFGAVIDRWTPPRPEPATMEATWRLVRDPEGFQEVVRSAGFDSVFLLEVEEPRTYSTAKAAVDDMLGWWRCAWRLESAPPEVQISVYREALESLTREVGPGVVELPERGHVIFGVAV